MPEENNEQRDAGFSNWEALESDPAFSDVEIPLVNGAAETEEEEESQETEANTETEEATEETEETEEEKSEDTEKEEVKDEAKEEESETEEEKESSLIEFKAEDIEGFEKEPEDGTWMAVAKAQGVEIEEDSFEAYNQAVESKYQAEIEKAKSLTKEALFADMKPETVAALKLIEMGIPEEEVFAPAQRLDSYLAMDDAALIREDLKLMNWDDERIDKEMELLGEKDAIGHQAAKIRDLLNVEKEKITQQRESLLSQYKENKERVTIQQREQSATEFKTALDTVERFMEVPISSDAKKAILTKFNRGDYDKELNNAKSRVELILYKELGQKALKHVENTAYQKGRDEKTKKLLNVPPVTSKQGNKVVENSQINNWEAIEEDFGENK